MEEYRMGTDGTLNSFVQPRETGEGEGVVAQGTHEPNKPRPGNKHQYSNLKRE